MRRILFVEDETELLKDLGKFFRSIGYEVLTAQTGTEALELANRYSPSVVVLDVMLHEGPAGSDSLSGYEICKALRDQRFDRPILFLTGRTSEHDKLTGFELGGDDYLTKPFSLLELRARVEALLRRVPARSVYRFDAVEVDLDNFEIRRDDGSTDRLTRMERDLLVYLIDNRGRLLEREELLVRVWGFRPGVESRTVDTHVGNLRIKLGDQAGAPRFIQTVNRVGYRFIAHEG